MGMDGKKDMEKKKEEYGDKKDMDKKDKEPSAELKAAMKACTENKLCKELMECKKKHMESGGKGDGKGDHEVCVKEMEACAADKECSTLHEKLQAAMKKDGGHGGKGGDGKDGGKGDYGGKKDGYDGKKDDGKKDDGKKGDYDGKKDDYDGKKGRQLAGHDDHDDDHDDDKKKDMDGKKDMEKKKEEYGDKKDMDKKDKEPSAELKAAMKACTENKL